MNRQGTMKLSGLIFTFVLSGLFFYAMVSFGVNIAIANDVNTTLLNNTNLATTFGSVEGNLTNQYTPLANASSAFDKAGNEENSQNPNVPTSKTATTVWRLQSEAFFNSIGIFVAIVLGLDPIILTTMTFLLIGSGIYLGWRAFRTGT